MQPKTKKARLARLKAEARKTLDTKTWPRVMQVFGYQNHKVVRKSPDDFANLKKIYEDAKISSMAAFIDIVRFEEERYESAMSFNISLRRRLTKEDQNSLEIDLRSIFSCPDILVGTRDGLESAFDWFRNFADGMKTFPTESVQVFDKIFGEAIEFFKGASKKVAISEVLDSVISGDDSVFDPSDTPRSQ